MASTSLAVTQLNVTTSVPTLNNDFSHSVGGADLWTPGIGVTGDGTAIAVMTASVVGSFDPMTIASRWSAVDGWNTFYDIYDQSDGPYTGTRWGDFVGVAADPAASDAVWASDETATFDGDWRTTVFQFTAPAIATAPIQSVFIPSTLPSFNSTTPQRVPVRVSWTASTAGATGATFDVEENIDGAGFVPLYTRTAATSLHALASGRPRLPVRGSSRERQLRTRRVRERRDVHADGLPADDQYRVRESRLRRQLVQQLEQRVLRR